MKIVCVRQVSLGCTNGQTNRDSISWAPVRAKNCIDFSTQHQYMIFYSGMIYSRLEWFLPVWNDSFQTKLSDHGKCRISRQLKEIGKKIFQITFTNIELEFWGWLSYPNSGTNPEGFLPSWKDLFQDGRNHSRMEGILPEWKYIYCY